MSTVRIERIKPDHFCRLYFVPAELKDKIKRIVGPPDSVGIIEIDRFYYCQFDSKRCLFLDDKNEIKKCPLPFPTIQCNCGQEINKFVDFEGYIERELDRLGKQINEENEAKGEQNVSL